MFASIGNLLLPVQNILLVTENETQFEVQFYSGEPKPSIAFVDKKVFPTLTLEGIRQHIRNVSQFGN